MTTLFISAFLLGLLFNAAPGAVFAETVRQGVRGGFRPALAVQIGSLAGDALWALLGLVGIGLLLQLEWIRWPVGIAGALYLFWLARDSWLCASQEFTLTDPATAEPQKAMRAGVLLSITNPQNIAYWAALGSALGGVGIHEPTAADYGIFFVGFMVSSVVWAFFCAAVVDRIFRRAGTRWAKVTYKLCAAAFLALAIGSVRDLMVQSPPLPHQDKSVVTGKP
jgi:chemosensory pili system protein ChpE